MEKYDRQAQSSAFVCSCAWHYALQQADKKRREVTFTDPYSEEDVDDYLGSVLPYLEGPRYVEGVDELFIRRIKEILAGMYDWHYLHSCREAINDANRMLAMLRENASLGRGIGIDEYELTPDAVRRAPGKPTHNTILVRGLSLDHLSDALKRAEKTSPAHSRRCESRPVKHSMKGGC